MQTSWENIAFTQMEESFHFLSDNLPQLTSYMYIIYAMAIGHEKYFLKFFPPRSRLISSQTYSSQDLFCLPLRLTHPDSQLLPGILVPSFLISFNLIQNSCLVLPRFTLSKLLTPSNTHLITDFPNSQFHSFSPRRTLYETHFTLLKLSLSQTPTDLHLPDSIIPRHIQAPFSRALRGSLGLFEYVGPPI